MTARANILTKGYSQYGADMGRRSIYDESAPQRCYVGRVRLDAGGYDAGGAYWGFAEPLYRIQNGEGTIDFFLRAPDRDTARRRAWERYPKIRFFRG